jgi:hypothetical protein
VPALVYTDDEVDELVGAVATALDRQWQAAPASVPVS